MSTDQEPNDFDIPLDVVARRLKTTELQILMYIRCGFIDAQETDNGWLLSKLSLSHFLGSAAPVQCSTGRKCSECSGCH